jgi:hypothetical protein
MKPSLCVVAMAAMMLGCSSSSTPPDPIDQAVRAESSKPTPQGLGAYLGITAPATNSPTEIAIKVLSASFWIESPTNVVVLQTRSVRISHTDSKGLLPPAAEHWTAVLVDTKFGRKIIFLQCQRVDTNSQAFWYYFPYELKPSA